MGVGGRVLASILHNHTLTFTTSFCLQLLSVAQQPVLRFFIALPLAQSIWLFVDREELGWTTIWCAEKHIIVATHL